MKYHFFNSYQKLNVNSDAEFYYYSLPQLEKEGVGSISRLPVSLRIVLESVLRHADGVKIKESDIVSLAKWQPHAERVSEIPFVVARILLQDFTGVPLLVDLAAMRSAVKRLGGRPEIIEPLVPVDLVVDHSVQVDFTRTSDAFEKNMAMEFQRNRSRYQFLKWGMETFKTFNVIPPGIGICHQVNLEYLAQVLWHKDQVLYPDTLVGTDSHTTMVNGLGVVGWGVGGIEAEAGMLGQPVYFLAPDVVGFHMSGQLQEGVTATDLVLHCTQILRKANVVGKFVEFFGEGAVSLSVPDRATIANMAPEYGATIGYFPVDEKTCSYLLATGRSPEHVDRVRTYFKAQNLFGMPRGGECDYSQVIELDLGQVEACIAGPKRPQDRILLSQARNTFSDLLMRPIEKGGYGKDEVELSKSFETTMQCLSEEGIVAGGGDQDNLQENAKNDVSPQNTNSWTEFEMINNRPTPDRVDEKSSKKISKYEELSHGDVVIAAITSCTNTSNPSVMLAAGLVAKKAVKAGLRISSVVKTSLAPGSRVVTEYLQRSGLQKDLDTLGFNLVGYGCTTCIGNSGPLDPQIESVIKKHDVIAASVLSGNRNFEARVHQSVKANFLMSPPLVVAFAIAGRINIDFASEPLGKNRKGQEVYLRDIWPSLEEISEHLSLATDPQTYLRLYSDFVSQNPMWNEIPTQSGAVYKWDETSTYIQEPPFFDKFSMQEEEIRDIKKARALAIFGDSVTTDHISPAGAIDPKSPAGLYLQQQGVSIEDFNSYGARRGNDRVMTRGTFSNIRIRNFMVSGTEGGVTLFQPQGQVMSIYDAAMSYQSAGIPLLIFAGKEYGTGSSRDWAAKGTRLLGVKAVIAESFERIHRSNLVGMGVLPCQFQSSENSAQLKLNGSEIFELKGLGQNLKPKQELTLVIHRNETEQDETKVILRLDTAIEVEYFKHGGILPYVLRGLLKA